MTAAVRVSPREQDAPRVVIVGAGLSGLLMAIRLREAGVEDFQIYEKAPELGGTWRENRYPGVACDITSHLYSYSFEPNPHWSHRYAKGVEIQAYLQDVAKKYGIRERIRFDTEVVEADWRDGRWQIALDDGSSDAADFLVCATGVLHRPKLPDVEGLDSFAGPAFHTARWPSGLEIRGRRVGIVGTGSSAVQLVPEVAEVAERLVLFQRTAQWIYPLPDHVFSQAEKSRMQRFPFLMRLQRGIGHFFSLILSAALHQNKFCLGLLTRLARSNLEQVKDPQLREKLTPGYPMACKRLVYSTTFYQAVQRPNAQVETQPIERVVPEGVVIRDGTRHALDVLVLATGFHAHDYMRPMQLVGVNGITLADAWKGGVKAHRSVAHPGFPNFFMLIGPHSPIGNYSLISTAEVQANYILQCIRRRMQGGPRAIAPKPHATAVFNEGIRSSFEGTVWIAGCQSWYLDESGMPDLWPWSFRRFRKEMERPDFEEFEAFE